MGLSKSSYPKALGAPHSFSRNVYLLLDFSFFLFLPFVLRLFDVSTFFPHVSKFQPSEKSQEGPFFLTPGAVLCKIFPSACWFSVCSHQCQLSLIQTCFLASKSFKALCWAFYCSRANFLLLARLRPRAVDIPLLYQPKPFYSCFSQSFPTHFLPGVVGRVFTLKVCDSDSVPLPVPKSQLARIIS